MSVIEIFRFAAHGLTSNKLRSSLTMLGVLIGVGAVILLVAVGNGSAKAVQAQIESLGTNVLTVSAGGPGARGGGSVGTQTRSLSLTMADARALQNKDLAPDVKTVSPVVSGSTTAAYQGTSYTISQTIGTYPGYLTTMARSVQVGSAFTQEDVTNARKVMVIGSDTAEELFAAADPIGQSVMLNGVPFQVIGVLATKGTSGLQSQDDLAIAPITAVQQSLTGYGNLSQIVMQAGSATAIDAAEAQALSILNTRHNVTDSSSGTFNVLNQASLLETRTATVQTFTVLLAAVAAISLLVGGIGITNIMLVTVTERTREIGIRKAIGAPRSAILGQFLVESTLLSLAGGLLGVLAGYAGSQFEILGTKPVIVPESVFLAFGVSAVIGLFFGSFPANRAAKLRPIEALRHE